MVVALADGASQDTDMANCGTDAKEAALLPVTGVGSTVVPFMETVAFRASLVSATLPDAGAYHHRVVTPTGNVYVA